MIYRWNGVRNFNITLKDSRHTLVECRGKGTQIAIPPSIHPATKMPYTATMELIDARNIVGELPDGLERKLRESFLDHGIDVGTSGNTKGVSLRASWARDNAMVSMAGILARGVERGERTLVERRWVRSRCGSKLHREGRWRRAVGRKGAAEGGSSS